MIYTLYVSVHSFAVLLEYSNLSEANQPSVYISQLSQRKRPKKLSKEEKEKSEEWIKKMKNRN
ncbi:hypothetical protein [Eggerthia catenaformis]|uniref:hypothetical protein n=1 Tax=Eggerthia catenaformis TaxID=31973 RepID=UPI0028EBCA8A|nr:hypothetical protein [Eggerthia catenaformis]